MKTRTKLTLATLCAALTAGVSGVAVAEPFYDYAKVKSTSAEYERVNTPREDCYSEVVPGRYRGGERSLTGPILGGITGAIVGAQVGKGHGNRAATAIGAVTGAIVGDRIQNDGYGSVSDREVRRCRVSDHWEDRVTGYRVVYEYRGQTFTTRLPYDPGRRIKVAVNVTPVEGDRQEGGWW